MAILDTSTEELSRSNIEVYRDAFAPPPARVVRAWEKAPVAAQAPRLHGQKIWKKMSRKPETDKENGNDHDVQLELDKEGTGSRKRVRILGSKENIGNAPWKRIEDMLNNARAVLAAKDTNGLGNASESQELCGNDQNDGKSSLESNSPNPNQFVPRKRTNTNHVITPKKIVRKSAVHDHLLTSRSPSKDNRRRSSRSLRRLTMDCTQGASTTEVPGAGEVKRVGDQDVAELPSEPQHLRSMEIVEQETLGDTSHTPNKPRSNEPAVQNRNDDERKGRRRSSRLGARVNRESLINVGPQASEERSQLPAQSFGINRESSITGEYGHIQQQSILHDSNENICPDGDEPEIHIGVCPDQAPEEICMSASSIQSQQAIEQHDTAVYEDSDSPRGSTYPATISPGTSMATGDEESDSRSSGSSNVEESSNTTASSPKEHESVSPILSPNCRLVEEPAPDSLSLEVDNEEIDVSGEFDEELDTESSVDADITDDCINDVDQIDEFATPGREDNETLELTGDMATAPVGDDDDTDLLLDFLNRMRAGKGEKEKKEASKKKASEPRSPLSILINVIETNRAPPEVPGPLETAQTLDEFDVSLTPSSKKPSKRNSVTAAEEDNGDTRSIRRSGRTRIPVVKTPAAASFMPVRRLGSDGDNATALRKNDEKAMAALTKVNTKKNKGEAVPAMEVLMRMHLEKELEKIDPSFLRKSLKEAFDEKTKRPQNQKGKRVAWAEQLEEFQQDENQAERGKRKKGKEGKEKKTPVKVGVRSNNIAREVSINGTPVSKRRAKGRS